MDKIKLSNVKVIFANLKDEGFGKSLTIDATNPETQEAIKTWVRDNMIGKSTPGEVKFKEYQPEGGDKTIQYAFKINDYTKFIGLNGLTIDDLGYGAEVSLMAQSFSYDNKFGKGTSASLTAVLIMKAVRTSADDDIEELLSEAGVNEEEKGGYAAAKEKWGRPEVVNGSITDDGQIDLDNIPFGDDEAQ